MIIAVSDIKLFSEQSVLHYINRIIYVYYGSIDDINRRIIMPTFSGNTWQKKELLAHIGDLQQIAGARPSMLTDGKAEGVKSISIRSGGGLNLTVLPGRAMDIPEAFYAGKPLHFYSNTGIVSPAYYDEPHLQWLRSFFGGLLTTCGITYCGAPCTDLDVPLGLHGRISNTAAEDIAIQHLWEGDEYIITVRGTTREASAMGEFLTLTRTVETRLGWKRFILRDVIENRGFEAQPLMMLYHFNFGFPLLSPRAKIVGPIEHSEPRDEASKADNGMAECLTFAEPQIGYDEKVFFHNLKSDSDGNTFIALLNRNIGDGTPLGIIMRFNKKELPALKKWKMLRSGFYVVGLEPGTVTPVGRAPLREQGTLPFIGGQESYSITVDFQVIDSLDELDRVEAERNKLC